ncbi:restriction endonuclease subunit S [Fibrella sp. USSR17]
MKLKNGYKQTEVGVIPEDWETPKFKDKDVTQLITCGIAATPQYVDESIGYPFLSSTNVKAGKVDWINYKYISKELHKLLYKNNPPLNGDILYSRVGTIGEAAIVDVNFEFSIYVSLTLIKPGQRLHNEFLKQLLNSTPFKNLAKREVLLGGGVGNLNVNVVREYLIPLPPTIAEQTAIATALSDTDALISRLEALIAKKRAIKQGAMQQLLKPKEGWEVKKLGDIAEVRDGTHQTPKYVEAGVPFYSVESVTANDFSNTKFISYEAHKLLTKNFRIEKGDILMTRIGSIGDCKYIDWDVDASFYVSLALLKVRKEYSPQFICHYSKTNDFKVELDLNSLQHAVPKKINLGQINHIEIRLPKDKEEQNRIAKILSDMDAEIAGLEEKLAKYKLVKQGMMQELLTGKIRLV